jgi:predicted transcriptional regulator of viral defense system
LDKIVDGVEVLYHPPIMSASPRPQQEQAIALLRERGMARLSEFIRAGITAATVSRLERNGRIVQLSRGLYQLPDAPLETHHSLAEAAKLVPRGVVCLASALGFHELSDRIPAQIWIAIGPRDWRPRITRPPIQIVRFPPKLFQSGIETYKIEGVPVRIYSPGKTIADLFRHAVRQQRRYGSGGGVTAAVQGMKEALRLRKATPAEIARYAEDAGVWKTVQPYLEALTVDA